jgi:hypothetical protein
MRSSVRTTQFSPFLAIRQFNSQIALAKMFPLRIQMPDTGIRTPGIERSLHTRHPGR